MALGEKLGVGKGGVGTKGDINLSPETQALSRRHHKENFEFNTQHAIDHLKLATIDAEKMKNAGDKAEIPHEVMDLLNHIAQGKRYPGVKDKT